MVDIWLVIDAYVVRPLNFHDVVAAKMVDRVLALFAHYVMLECELSVGFFEYVDLETQFLLDLLLQRFLTELEIETLLESEILFVFLGHHSFDKQQNWVVVPEASWKVALRKFFGYLNILSAHQLYHEKLFA